MSTNWGDDYGAIWDTFVGDLTTFHQRLGRAVPTTPPRRLHAILRDLHWIPYVKAKRLFDQPVVDHSARNIGAVTGLFFEQAVAALVVPYLRHRLPGAHFERNSCSVPAVRDIARDPDLFVANGDGYAVIEMKVSPKKRDLAHVEQLRARHNAAGIGYYLVGGEISAAPETFERYSNQQWACFVSAPKRKERLLERLPTLDVVMEAE